MDERRRYAGDRRLLWTLISLHLHRAGQPPNAHSGRDDFSESIAARGERIIKMDAHSTYQPDFIPTVRALSERLSSRKCRRHLQNGARDNLNDRQIDCAGLKPSVRDRERKGQNWRGQANLVGYGCFWLLQEGSLRTHRVV